MLSLRRLVRIGKGKRSTVSYYHAYRLGSTRLLTSSSGSVLFADSYQPYGQDNGTPTGTETYKFTDKPFYSATGLYYYYQRWYHSSLGRFISLDPLSGQLSKPQTLNGYVYVTDSPLNNKDPSGQLIEILIGAAAGGLIGWGLCGFSLSSSCLAQAGAGAVTGGIAGATFGLSLGVMGVGGSVTATVGQTLLAGAISGSISGLYSFDLNVLIGKEEPTPTNLLSDVGFGVVTGAIGGGISSIFGNVKTGTSVSDIEKSGLNAFDKVSNFFGFDTSKMSPNTALSKVGIVVLGGGVELGKALVGGLVDPAVKWTSDWVRRQIGGAIIAPGWVYYPTPAYGKGLANPE